MTRAVPFMPESERWLCSLRLEGRSASTLDCYSRDLRDVSAAIGGATLGALISFDQATLDRTNERWSSSGVAASTIYRRFSALRSFARHLAQRGIRGSVALLALKYPQCTRSKRPALNLEEVGFVVRAPLLSDDWTAARDDAAFSVQANSGLTPAETVALNVRDVKPCSIHVTATTFRPRIVGVEQPSTSLIERYLAAVPFRLPASGPLFVNRCGRRLSERTLQLSFWRRKMEYGLVGPCGPSSLRRRHAELLVADGSSPEALAVALGLHVSSVFRFFEGARR